MQNNISVGHSLQFYQLGYYDPDYYGSPLGGDIYFSRLMGREEWKSADDETKLQALFEATQHIDRFSFIGAKATVAQYLQFPRGLQTTVPLDITYATYEEAYQIMLGRDIEDELNELRIQQRRFDKINTQYMQGVKPSPNVTAGILSSKAWRMIAPYFSRADEIQLVRI